MSWPWDALGLSGPADLRSIRRAYAQRLKTAHPEEDPEGFQRLHAAYQAARRSARNSRRPEASPVPEAPAPAQDFEAPAVEEEPLEEEPGFDYEALFAEGDRERREAQRRRAEERLKAAQERRRLQEQAQRDRALASEEAASAAFAALHALEVLYSAGVSAEEWVRFLHSSTFLNAQHNLDFIFGLEDFLAEHPGLPEEVKRKIFLAYHFYKRKPSAVYLGLYRLLLDSYRNAGRENRELERGLWVQRKPYVILAVVMGILVALTLLFNSGHPDSAPPSGSADTARASLDSPGSHDRSGEIENEVPLDGGEGQTSFFGMVTAYAPEDFPGLYAVTGRGTAENGEETFQWIQCTGQDANLEELVMNYYLSEDKRSLYCVPEDKQGEEVEMVCTHAWRGISVYRCVED